MATQITNLLSVEFAIPFPIGDVLAPREKKQYPNVPYADLINDVRFDEMVAKHQILIEDEEPTSRAVPEVTTEAINLWVSTAGSDNNPGNKSRPLNTLTAAIELIPRVIAHPVHVRVAAGDYTVFPEAVNRTFESTGQLVIEGTGTAPIASGPYTLTSYTSTGDSRTALVVTGAGWTTDQFYGKWVRFTSGAAAGRRIPVFSNTTDTIHAPIMWDWATGVPANPDTFEIVDPPCSVTVAHPISIVQGEMDGDVPGSAFGTSRARLSIVGFKFNVTATYSQAVFTVIGGFTNLAWCTLAAPMGSVPDPIYAFRATNVDVNGRLPLDPALFDDSQLSDSYTVNLQLVHGVAPPNVGAAPYTGSASINSCITGICSRAKHEVYSGEMTIKEFCLTQLYIGLGVIGQLLYGVIDNGVLGWASEPGVDISILAKLYALNVHIESVAGADGIDALGSNDITLFSVTGNAANISGYGVRLHSLCRVRRNAASTLSGTTNDYILVKGAAGAWPASTATDAAGGFITTE